MSIVYTWLKKMAGNDRVAHDYLKANADIALANGSITAEQYAQLVG